MLNKKLETILFFHNPWWREKRVPSALLPDFQRLAFFRVKDYLKALDRIIVIKGPRRTGKTTLLYQIIDFLLQEGVEPFDILFLSFDDPSLRIDLEEIFKVYQNLREKTLEKGKVYCFLDEVHFLNNWQFIVKKYFDKKYPIKFLISSSSASLFKTGLESLAGRTVEEILLPFSFREFVFYHFRKDNNFFDFFKKKQITPYENEIKILFKRYLIKGGFPHILSVKEPTLWQKLLREDVLEKVIYRDLVDLYGIREPQKLEKMFLYLADISGQILNISNIAKNVGLTRIYTENYLNYLEKAYLVFRFSKFSFSVGEKVRSPSKVYLIDSGLMSIFGTPEDFILESVVAKELLERSSSRVYYFRNKEEVDFVVLYKKKVIPIEVKNKDKINQGDFKNLVSFLEKFKAKKGILLCRDIFGDKKIGKFQIKVLPIWYWLLFESLK